MQQNRACGKQRVGIDDHGGRRRPERADGHLGRHHEPPETTTGVELTETDDGADEGADGAADGAEAPCDGTVAVGSGTTVTVFVVVVAARTCRTTLRVVVLELAVTDAITPVAAVASAAAANVALLTRRRATLRARTACFCRCRSSISLKNCDRRR